MPIPAAIIFVNNNFNDTMKNKLIAQLHVDEAILLSEFSGRLATDPNYVNNIHNNNLRILVLLSDFSDYTNRQFADAVIFVKGGLASILFSNFGPPTHAYMVDRLNIFQLLNS